MSKKRLIALVLMFLLVAPIVFAVNDTSCSGFFGAIKCFLWGNPNLPRSNVVGEAAAPPAAPATAAPAPPAAPAPAAAPVATPAPAVTPPETPPPQRLESIPDNYGIYHLNMDGKDTVVWGAFPSVEGPQVVYDSNGVPNGLTSEGNNERHTSIFYPSEGYKLKQPIPDNPSNDYIHNYAVTPKAPAAPAPFFTDSYGNVWTKGDDNKYTMERVWSTDFKNDPVISTYGGELDTSGKMKVTVEDNVPLDSVVVTGKTLSGTPTNNLPQFSTGTGDDKRTYNYDSTTSQGNLIYKSENDGVITLVEVIPSTGVVKTRRVDGTYDDISSDKANAESVAFKNAGGTKSERTSATPAPPAAPAVAPAPAATTPAAPASAPPSTSTSRITAYEGSALQSHQDELLGDGYSGYKDNVAGNFYLRGDNLLFIPNSADQIDRAGALFGVGRVRAKYIVTADDLSKGNYHITGSAPFTPAPDVPSLAPLPSPATTPSASAPSTPVKPAYDVSTVDYNDKTKGVAVTKDDTTVYYDKDGKATHYKKSDGNPTAITPDAPAPSEVTAITSSVSTEMIGPKKDVSAITYTDPSGKPYVQVGSTTLPKDTFDTYSSTISSEKDGTIHFGETGTITSSDTNNIRTTTIQNNKDAPAVTTYSTPDGGRYSKDDGWETTNTGLKNGDSHTIAVKTVPDGGIKVTNTEGDDITETTTYATGPKKGTKEERISDADGVTSHQLLDKDGKIIGDADITDNKETQFNFYDKDGRVIGTETCDDKCNGDPTLGTNAWSARINGEYKACMGTKDQCFTDGKPTGPFSKDCNSNKACEAAIDAKKTDDAWNLEGPGFEAVQAMSRGDPSYFTGQKYAAAAQKLGVVLGFRPGWEGLSNWIMPDVTQKWNKWASDTFDGAMSSQWLVSKGLCHYDEVHRTDNQDGSSALFISINGIPQHVGSITSEKTPKLGPVLCSEELPCIRGECRKDGFCYEDDILLESTFYKITWGVTAPQDQSFTPYRDEDGVAIKYNIVVRPTTGSTVGEKYLYPSDGHGTSSTLTLVNGERDANTFLTYSPNDYNEACVIFSAPPKDDWGDEVKEMCNPIVPSAAGVVEWDESTRDESASAAEQSVKSGSVGQAQI